MPDKISITSLSVHLAHGLGPSAFSLDPAPPCPALLSLDINLHPRSVAATATGDSMSGLGVNYSAVSKAVYALASDRDRKFADAWELLGAIVEVPLALKETDVESVRASVDLPRATLHALGVIYEGSYMRGGQVDRQSCLIRDLKAACIVGLHPHERKEKQRLELDVLVEGTGVDWEKLDHKALADEILDFVSTSSYGTIESLDHFLAEHLCQSPLLQPHQATDEGEVKVSITIRKPSAIPFAVPSVAVTRNKGDYDPSTATATTATRSKTGSDIEVPPTPMMPGNATPGAGPSSVKGLQDSSSAGRVFIAVGSNIGDSVGHIRRAIELLREGGCALVDCSRLYESTPMYVEDQERFTNGVIEVTTAHEPMDLLRLLKRTERAVGRTKTFTNGPRVIDLDLVFYRNQVVKIGDKGAEEDADGVRWLECPHASLAEREFVLRPLADIAPEFKHPSMGFTVRQMLDNLLKPSPPALQPIIPFSGPSRPLRLVIPATPHIMAIFNATPDSFSDGDPARTDVAHATEACRRLIDGPYPPCILDIGGMSTRPKSEPCTEEEELARVIPLIKAIRASSSERLATIPISIDTYRPTVARAAVQAGASCINDVRGGREEGMMRTMAELDVPVVLMHSRGDSTSMTTAELQDYSELGGVVEGVKIELGHTVRNALKAGVKRWNIILDPGLGFAKSQHDNLVLLNHLPTLVSSSPSSTPPCSSTSLKGYPLLVGGSRKGFVGKIIERNVASERGFGDAAVNGWCAASGVVDVIRVHEPREAGEVVRMTAAIRDARGL